MGNNGRRKFICDPPEAGKWTCPQCGWQTVLDTKAKSVVCSGIEAAHVPKRMFWSKP